MKKKVVIIGAGPAGLTAGYELLKQSDDYDVTILEELDVVGGIARTINYRGNRLDIGGHRFFSKSDIVNAFWDDILPMQGADAYDDLKLGRHKTLSEGGPDPEKVDQVMLIRNRVSRIYYLGKFFDYPISLKLQTFTNLGLTRTIVSGFSYLKSCMIKKEETSLENFFINRFGKKLYHMFFEEYTKKLWGRHPKDISADWGGQRVKGLSVKEVLKDTLAKTFKIKQQQQETSLIEEFKYPKYGPGQLWGMVASEFQKMGGQIEYSHTVKKIKVQDQKIISVICEVKGKEKEIKGDIFISSMPLKDLVAGFDNDVPRDIKDIALGLPYRDFVTVGLLVKHLKLKNKTKIKTLGNIIPDCWIYVQEPNVQIGRIQIMNNWSPYMVKNPDETIWLGLEYFCNENDHFWNMNEKECAEYAIDELVKMHIINRDDVIDYHREKVKKAYPAYFDTYAEIDKLISYLNTYDNLYCIGRNGQHHYNNMDHSMLTSFACVNNIIKNEKNRDNIWNINTENDYHEQK